MDTVELKVRKREKKGKGRARRLRASGEIPGVVYSSGREATPLAVYFADLKKALGTGSNVVLQLKFADSSGEEQYAVVKDIQTHPTKSEILHFDLHGVELDTEIEASVPVELLGSAPGVMEGGVLDHQLWEVNVEALPTAVPSFLEMDISGLDIGDQARVEDVRVPEGVRIVDDPQMVVVAILAPEMEEEEEEEEELLEGEEGVEVPVVGEEEEGEESAESAKSEEGGGGDSG